MLKMKKESRRWMVLILAFALAITVLPEMYVWAEGTAEESTTEGTETEGTETEGTETEGTETEGTETEGTETEGTETEGTETSILKVDITNFPEPKAGQLLNFNVEGIGRTEGIKITKIIWKEGERIVQKGETAKSGTTYKASMELTAETGYTFAENVAATVNRRKSTIIVKDMVKATIELQYTTLGAIDKTPPQIIGITDGKVYCEAQTFTVKASHLDKVTVNGRTVTLNADNSYTLQADGQIYRIVVADKSGQFKTVTVTVNNGHTPDGGRVTKEATNTQAGSYTCSCKYCNVRIKDYVIPQKLIEVQWGKKLTVNQILDNRMDGFQEIILKDASKYKKYFKVNNDGTIKTTINSKVKIKKAIPVQVVIDNRCYTVNVKIVIPKPKVKITKKKNGSSYKYTFKYNIKKATRIKVRCKEAKSNAAFDKYLSKPKSNKNSYITCPNSVLKKHKNRLTFNITAYYGKNKSETYTVRK